MGAAMAGRVKEDSGVEPRRLATLARHLGRAYPTGRWWPYDDPFEIAISAILTQQTRWSAVERAMAALRRRRLLTPRALAAAGRTVVEGTLRPTGFYRQKTRAVQGIARILVERFGGSMERALQLPTDELRKELLSWPGVGQETADSILLYAAGRATFVVDAYTYRVMRRFGVIRANAQPSYAAVSSAWAHRVPGGAPGFQAMHGAIVEHGKRHCTRTPDCSGCPLRWQCPKIGVELP